MKSILFLILALFPFVSFAQSYVDEIPFVDDKIKFETILNIDSVSAQELYSRAKLAISDMYKSGKSVIDSYDDNALNLVVKGTTHYPLKDFLGTVNIDLDHTLIMQFKDGKVKLTYTDLIASTVNAECIIAENPKVGNCPKMKYPKKIKEEHAKQIVKTWEDFKSTVQSKLESYRDDW